MKRLSIMMLGALGLFAASCDEAPEAPKPQENPQEPIFAAGDITSATDGAFTTTVLNLEEYRGATGIPVMKLTGSDALPQGATVKYQVELCASEDFSGKVMTLDTHAGEENVYTVDPIDWNDAHVALFGKSPKVKTAYYRVPVYVVLDGSDYRYESNDYYAATGKIEETCMDQGFTIDDTYYFMGDATTWDLNVSALTPFAFTHSDRDVYDDPVFVVTFKTDKEQTYWKIAPKAAAEAGDWAKVYGPEIDGDESLTGTVIENGKAGKIAGPGNYKVTINMEAMTYTIEKLLRPEYLYTPGDANGWNQLNSSWMQYDNKNEVSKGYFGLFPVKAGGFKVCTEPDWDNENTYGAESDSPADNGSFVLGQEGKNIITSAPGVFWASVQYDENKGELTTYELTPITSIGIIGSFPASNWASDVEMTPNEDNTVWTADVTFDAGSSWKIRFNNDWAFNLGGEKDNMDHAILDGENYNADEAGTYTVTITLQPGVPTVTCVKK